MQDNLIGKRLGNFEIVAEIGAGGMGIVYKALQPSLQRVVAIKVLSDTLVREEEYVKRFFREAQSIGQIDHPNVVGVIDLGHEGNIHYIVMDLIKGTELEQIIHQEGPMQLRRVLDITRQVAAGLSAAHEIGIVHRDIKPRNIMVDGTGHVKVMDFGIAKVASATTATVAGQTFGTAQYMSPEQCKGKALDGRSDIYSLGIVLYQMLAGRVPFEAETPLAIILKVVSDPVPPILEARPELSDSVVKLLNRAIARDPADRFQSAEEMQAEIVRLLRKGDDALERSSTEELSFPVDKSIKRPIPAAFPLPREPRISEGVALHPYPPDDATEDIDESMSDQIRGEKYAPKSASHATPRPPERTKVFAFECQPDGPRFSWSTRVIAFALLPFIAVVGGLVWRFAFTGTSQPKPDPQSNKGSVPLPPPPSPVPGVTITPEISDSPTPAPALSPTPPPTPEPTTVAPILAWAEAPADGATIRTRDVRVAWRVANGTAVNGSWIALNETEPKQTRDDHASFELKKEGEQIITVIPLDQQGAKGQPLTRRFQYRAENHPPKISKAEPDKDAIEVGGEAELTITATDPDGDQTKTEVSEDGGKTWRRISGNSATIVGRKEGVISVAARAIDSKGLPSDIRKLSITVRSKSPPAPARTPYVAIPREMSKDELFNRGVENDDKGNYAEAAKWYLKAAEKGDGTAMNNLGRLYHKGLGVPKDDRIAFGWLRKGAEAGDWMAMQSLGQMYQSGSGVTKDPQQADYWFDQAAAAKRKAQQP